MSDKVKPTAEQLKELEALTELALACRDRIEGYKSGKEPFKLDEHIHYLLWDEPFLATIFRMLKKYPNTKIGTLRVCFRPSILEFVIEYNPNFMVQLLGNPRKGVLQHEGYHIALGHVTNRSPEGYSRKKVNYAQDFAINSLNNVMNKIKGMTWIDPLMYETEKVQKAFKHLDDTGEITRPILEALGQGLMPGEGQYKDLPPGKSMDYYLEVLPEPQEGSGDDDEFSLESLGQCLDDHSQWDDNDQNVPNGNNDGSGEGDDGEISNEGMRRIAAHKLDDIRRRAVEEAVRESQRGGDGWGNVPSHAQIAIKASLEHTLDPRKVVSSFVKKSVKSSRRKSWMRVNRRFKYIHPGRAVKYTAKMLIAIDGSGSVDDEFIGVMIGWLGSLAKFASFTVIWFDTQVRDDDECRPYVWEKGRKVKMERPVQGGTDFNAPTDYANAHDFDGMMILTDMGAPQPKRCNCQRLWITNKQHFNNMYMKPVGERVLCIDA